MNDLKALELIIKMKELGITYGQIQEFKELYKAPEPVVSAEDFLKAFNQDEFTDEEITYYATPYYDELQTKKQMKNNNIKDEVRE